MIVLTSSPSENPLNILQPKEELLDEENDKNRSFFLSLGLDTGSMDLRSSSPDGSSSIHGEKLLDHQTADRTNNINDLECVESTSSPLNHISTNDQLTSLIAHVANSNRNTQCSECGKHFRKGSSLRVHMTLNHGFPPPGSSISSDDQAEKSSECGTMAEQANGIGEEVAAPVQHEIKEIKSMIGEMRSVQATTRVEQLLTTLDTRVARLEKQLEMALNSIYTLVQLQTGINSSVTRFREETCEQLKTVKSLLSDSTVD